MYQGQEATTFSIKTRNISIECNLLNVASPWTNVPAYVCTGSAQRNKESFKTMTSGSDQVERRTDDDGKRACFDAFPA